MYSAQLLVQQWIQSSWFYVQVPVDPDVHRGEKYMDGPEHEVVVQVAAAMGEPAKELEMESLRVGLGWTSEL